MTHADIQPLPAVVVNPTKLANPAKTRRQVARCCAEHGFLEPLWFETTATDTGEKQASFAVTQGADVVMALGGDGTVRAVAKGLLGTPVALGVVPFGTGNLLANNLGLPQGDVPAAIEVSLIGDDAALDCGEVYFRMADGRDRNDLFLVMSGVGFDADIMANTPAELKKHVGAAAYALTGAQRFLGATTAIQVSVQHPRLGRTILQRRVQTVVVGNCGNIMTGISLMPDANPHDGLFDVAAISAQGILGWASVAKQILFAKRYKRPYLEIHQGTEMALSSTNPIHAQIDGDSIGLVNRMRCTVAKAKVIVRVPTEDPVGSVLDEATTQRNAAAAAQGKIDLRDL